MKKKKVTVKQKSLRKKRYKQGKLHKLLHEKQEEIIQSYKKKSYQQFNN
jgi:hypothetical protein